MSRKAETVFTSRMINKAAHEERKAARIARRHASAFERFVKEQSNGVACYVNVNGVVMPVAREF